MFDWRRFVDLADSSRTSNDEAALRTAISRAYYAVYHVTTETVRARAIVRPRGHRIWEQLQEVGRAEGRPDLVEAGLSGRQLKRWREQADYHSPFNRDNRRQPPLDLVTREVLAATRELLDLLDAL